MALFDNITAYYKFEKNHPTQKDSGPYANHGTSQGSTSIISSGVANLGNAIRITPGAGNYVHIPTHPYNELWKTTSIGICFRVNSYSSAGCILTKTDADASHSAGLRIDSNTLHFSEGNSDKFTGLQANIPADGAFHWLTISTDAATPTMTLFIDGVQIGTAATGYFLFANAHNLRIGAPEQSFFGSSTNAADVDVAEVVLWNTNISLADHQAWRASGAGYSLPQGTITLDEIGHYRCIQRDKDGSNTKTVARSGDYSLADPHYIEYCLYDYDTTTTLVKDWTVATNLLLDTSTKRWAANFLVPKHTNYCRYKVRSKDAAGNVLETSEFSVGKVGVGINFLLAGQSNMSHMYDWYPTTNTNGKGSIFINGVWSRTITHDGASWDSIGAGANILLDKLQTAFNCPVGFICTAVGGTGLYQTDGAGYWLDTSLLGIYTAAMAKVTASGGDFECGLWHQGEADAHAGTSSANYQTALTTLYGRWQSYTGRNTTQLFMGVGTIGPLTDGSTAANISNIRYAGEFWSSTNTGAFYLGSNVGATLAAADNYHYVTGSYQLFARYWAQSILFKYGLAQFPGGGPYVTQAWWMASDKKIHLVVDKRFMTVLKEADGTTDGGSLTGLEVSVDNWSTTETINSTAFSGNEVVLTVNALTTGNTVKIRYQQAAAPVITNPVYGNLLPQGATIGFPLRSFPNGITAREVSSTPTDPTSPLVSVTSPINLIIRNL